MSIARAQLRWSSIESHKHNLLHYTSRSTSSLVNPSRVAPAFTTNPRIRGRLSRGYCHNTIVMASVSITEVATAQSARPGLPRSGHCAATLPGWHKDDVIMFGGYVEDGDKKRWATSEAYTFSVAAHQWTPVQYAPGPVPQARLTTQAVVVGDHLWLIGGWDPQEAGTGGVFLNDVWRLDLRSYAWEQVEVQGEQLQPISRFQAAAVGQHIYIHTHRNISNILRLDTAALPPHLELLPVAAPAGGSAEPGPSSRGLHSMTAVGNQLYIFGGAPQSGPMMADLWRLDLATMAWQCLKPEGQQPAPRCSHAAAAVGDSIVYCGGAFYKEGGGLQVIDELLVLDTASMAWRKPELAEGQLPSARNASSMVPATAGSSTLVLHGGWKAFVESYDDTFLLELK